MKLSKFKFDLPDELIVNKPTYYRDDSKLLVLHRTDGTIEHKDFRNIVDYFGPGDCFVMNNTKVFPARIYGNKEKTGARIEVFLLRELNPDIKLWDVLVDPARKIRIGNKLYFGPDESLVAEVIDNTTSRGRTIRFLDDMDHDEFKKILLELGEAPLPEYMGRAADKNDKERYQSIFAEHEGAVVAPASMLHFTPIIHKRLQLQDCRFAFLTVHNNLGPYRDIEVEDLSKHKMESEEMHINQECCDVVNRARDLKKKICVVGTSSLRAVESAVATDGYLKTFDGWSNRFIFPPYDFDLPTCLLTNFHMPSSTLLMMTSAFGGHDFVMNAYEEAVAKKYRFGAYGDAMLIVD